MQQKSDLVLSGMLGSSLFFVVACRGGSTKAGEEGRINIVVKKVASVVWLNTDGPEGKDRGEMTTKWNSFLNNTSHPSVNSSSDLFSASNPPPPPFLLGAGKRGVERCCGLVVVENEHLNKTVYANCHVRPLWVNLLIIYVHIVLSLNKITPHEWPFTQGL